MEPELKQNKRNVKIFIKLHENMVEYKIERIHENIEAFIPFEKVSRDTFIASDKISGYIFFAILFLFGAALTLPPSSHLFSLKFGTLFLLGGISFILCGWYTNVKLIFLKCENYNIGVLKSKQGQDFINKIKEYRSKYLKEVYGKINWENNADTELNRFRYLNSNGVITDSEFEEIKKTILNK